MTARSFDTANRPSCIIRQCVGKSPINSFIFVIRSFRLIQEPIHQFGHVRRVDGEVRVLRGIGFDHVQQLGEVSSVHAGTA